MSPPRHAYALEQLNPEAFVALRLEATGPHAGDFLCEYANPAAQALLEENPVGLRLLGARPELAGGRSDWRQVLLTGVPLTRVLPLHRGAGTRRVLTRAARVEEALLAVWLVDVTDTERFMSETAAFEERMLSFVEAMPAPFLALDPHLRFTYVNAAAESWLGKGRQALIGRPLEQEYAGAPGSTLSPQVRRVLTTGQPTRFAERSPSRCWEVTVSPGDSGVLIYLHDITVHRPTSLARALPRAHPGPLAHGGCGGRHGDSRLTSRRRRGRD